MASSLKVYRAALLATSVLLLICFSAIVYVAVIAQRCNETFNRQICQTSECVALGASMSKSINLSADPCHDFYEYACGNFGQHVHYKFQEDGVNLQGVNFVETMTAMRYEVLDRLHEVLTIPLVKTSGDSELEAVHSFTQSYYKECQTWWQREDLGTGESTSSAKSFVNSLLERLLTGVINGTELWPELLLARIASTGVGGLFRVSISNRLIDSMLKESQPNSPLRDLTRAHIVVNLSETLIWSRVHSSALDHLTQLLLRLSPSMTKALQPNITVRRLASMAIELFGSDLINGSYADKSVTRRVRELKDDYSMGAFRWRVFFDELMSLSGASLDNEGLILVENFQQTRKLLETLGDARMNNRRPFIQALLVLDWLLRFRVFLPSELSAMLAKPDEEAEGGAAATRIAEDDRLLSRIPNGAAVARECLRLSRHLLQPVVERMYRLAYLPDDFSGVHSLVGWVKSASAAAAQTSASWVSLQSRLQVAEKILAVRQAIGFDELTAAEVKRLHTPCIARHVPSAPDASDFASLYFAALCSYQARALQALTPNFTAPVFSTLNTLVVNAYNYFRENRVIFPLALLQPPMYHPGYPLYANLAGLGFIAGHEIGHALDAYGHTLSKDGAIGHVWDSVTEKGYLNRMKCAFDDYLTLPDSTSGGLGSLSNDVSDIIGVSAAYRGLLKATGGDFEAAPSLPGIVSSLNNEQLFFVQLAQCWCAKADRRAVETLFGHAAATHSSNRRRVLGMMRHSPHFARAFGCVAGSPMNPRRKCVFW